jgi:hypothetical protein
LETKPGKPFLDVLGELGQHNFNQRGTALLNLFSLFDDTWWIQSLRKLQEQKKTSSLLNACLSLVLDRGRTLRSVWKRKGDLAPEELKAINEKTDRMFASPSGHIELANKRKQLLEKGVLINAFKFKPYSRRQPSGESIMLVKSKNGIQSASAMSPLIRNLSDSWAEDIHLYAFVERGSTLTLEQVVQLIGSGFRK